MDAINGLSLQFDDQEFASKETRREQLSAFAGKADSSSSISRMAIAHSTWGS
jgi:hypothetical protein